MSLIYADDFQQLKYAAYIANFGAHGGSQPSTDAVNTGMEAMGFERPMSVFLRQANGGSNQYYYQTPVGYWDAAAYGCLCIYARPPTSFTSENVLTSPGVNALKRKIQQKGDTVFVNFRWAFPANFNFNASHAGIVFIKCGYGISISLSTKASLVLNDVDTDYTVVFDSEVPLITEIIAGPDYVELWVGLDMIARQTRAPFPVDFFTLGFEPITALPNAPTITSEVTIKLFSLIIADSSGTSFNTRIGRKQVRSYEANAVTTDATLETTGPNVLATIRRPVQDLALNTGTPVYGNLFSPKPFTKTTLAGTKPAELVARGACIHVQAKRRTPANDGLAVFPFITIGGLTFSDAVGQSTRSRWTSKCTPIDIPANTTFTTFDFGYTYDYPDVEKLYVDDREKVEVYGTIETTYVPPLLAFQSRVPAVAQQDLQTAEFVGYSYDYTTSKLNINNLTYLREQ